MRPAPPPTHGTTFPRRLRVLGMRTGGLGSCDAEFHSGYLLRVGASVGAVPRPKPSRSPSAAVPSACPLAFLSLGERGGRATCLSPGLGSWGRGGDRAELGPEGGGRGSEGGLGRAGEEPRGESGGIGRTRRRAGAAGGGSGGNRTRWQLGTGSGARVNAGWKPKG